MTSDIQEQIEGLKDQRIQLIEQLSENPSGLAWCAEHTQIADEVCTVLYRALLNDLGYAPDLAILATGGFGRRELCVHSDIDITVVPGDETSPELDGAIKRLFQEFHWAYSTVLRLDVGYSYRLVSDASGLDPRTRTGLLDMRLLAGSEALARTLEEALVSSFPAGEFVLAKIQERQATYQRFHDTPLVVEPNLKEGAGGIRDFHCASWIGEAIGERTPRPTVAYDTIMRYRNLLHAQAGKCQDLLSRSRQNEISEIVGISPTGIVDEVAGAGIELFTIYNRATERLHNARFTILPGVVAFSGEVRILPECSVGAGAMGVAIATKLGLRVSDLPARAANDPGGPAALFALASGEPTLRNLDRCTLLEQLLPDLTRCRRLAGRDGSHTFTVMEHTLRVIRNLDSLASSVNLGPGNLGQHGFLQELRASLDDVEPLYLAALLHDVAKINPRWDHSVEGARIAAEVCAKWDLDTGTSELTTWLIREHLTMARFIRMRDVAHPSTIREFAQIVERPDRLALLTLFTWADVSAVAPGVWTPAQDAFTRILHDQTLRLLQGESLPSPEPIHSRQRLLRQLQTEFESHEEVEKFLDSLPAYYLAGANSELVKFHLALAKRATAGEATVEHHSLPDLGATEITVCALDSPGLLSHLLGALYAQDLSLVGVRACTTAYDPAVAKPAVAIDVFTVSFGGRPAPVAMMNETTSLLRQIVAGVIHADDLLMAKSKDPNRRQQVNSWKYHAGSPGILELRTPRGRGMPFRLARWFTQQGWNILAARVGQWAANGSAAFYLLGPDESELKWEAFEKLFAVQNRV